MASSDASEEVEGQLCGDCGALDAFEVCYGCAEVYYCDKVCQKNSWKRRDHKKECAELQAKQKVALLGKHGPDPALSSGGEGGGAAPPPPVSAEGGKSADADPVHPCLICLEKEEDAIVGGAIGGMCTACGQNICGKCWPELMASAHGEECPKCRASMGVSDEERVRRLQQLIRHREPGRHTSHAQCMLAGKYTRGEGVEQDLVEAARLFKLAAEGGYALAQYNLGVCYRDGRGVEQDDAEAVRWYRAAVVQAFAFAQTSLGWMYRNGRGVDQDYVEVYSRCTARKQHGTTQSRADALQR